MANANSPNFLRQHWKLLAGIAVVCCVSSSMALYFMRDSAVDVTVEDNPQPVPVMVPAPPPPPPQVAITTKPPSQKTVTAQYVVPAWPGTVVKYPVVTRKLVRKKYPVYKYPVRYPAVPAYSWKWADSDMKAYRAYGR